MLSSANVFVDFNAYSPDYFEVIKFETCFELSVYYGNFDFQNLKFLLRQNEISQIYFLYIQTKLYEL